ncbi:hypothetical protein FEM08_05520 [Flavobacterium gilvum]|nr:hypothetical protein FEM08_05520 [Flavobacterium gilvum]
MFGQVLPEYQELPFFHIGTKEINPKLTAKNLIFYFKNH